MKIINLFKLLGECISKEIAVLDKQLDYYSRLSEEDKYHIETGKKFNIGLQFFSSLSLSRSASANVTTPSTQCPYVLPSSFIPHSVDSLIVSIRT